MTTSPAQPQPLPAILRLFQCVEFPWKLGLCHRIFSRTLAAHGVCWVRTAPGPVWKLDLVNPTHRWIVCGYYEGPAFWRWLQAHRAEVGTVVDSGANIGQTVLNFAAYAPAARILAYEPGRDARAWLAESVAANGFGQVIIESAGLGLAPGAARLAADGPADLRGSWNKVSATEGEPIALVALDDELDRHGLARLDLWKLDVEGHELPALQGARRALAAGRVRAVYIEVAGESGRASIDFLTRLGYVAHGISRGGRLTAWTQSHNYDNALCLAPGETALQA